MKKEIKEKLFESTKVTYKPIEKRTRGESIFIWGFAIIVAIIISWQVMRISDFFN